MNFQKKNWLQRESKQKIQRPCLINNSSSFSPFQNFLDKMVDATLLCYMAFWYLGNYYYNIQNKTASNAADGTKYIMILSVIQLAVGVIYSSFLWLAPDARKPPALVKSDLSKMALSGFLMAGAHAASVFSLAAGEVAFAQIVKAAEPAFTAVVSCFIYGKPLSTARWLCLIPIIAGVALAALKVNGSTGSVDFNFTYGSLIGAGVSNLFAAFKSNEIKRLMGTPGIKDRLGSAGNQFAVQTMFATVMLIPLMMYREYNLIPEFVEKFNSNSVLSTNLILSGLTFYIYNELATYTLTKVSAITQSIANTAKRVVVIVGSAIVFNETISGLKAVGCVICIGGVFLDSVIDDLLYTPPVRAEAKQSAKAILPAEVKASAAAIAKQTPNKASNSSRGRSPAAKNSNVETTGMITRGKSPGKKTPAKSRSPSSKKKDD